MTGSTTLHATSVSIGGQAVLIIGASGSGKSSLALDLISRGAMLIADDQTVLNVTDGCLIASAPATILGQIEARGIGILAVETAGPCPVRLVVNLDKPEPKRLPVHRVQAFRNIEITVIFGAKAGNLAAAILVWMKGGRIK